MVGIRYGNGFFILLEVAVFRGCKGLLSTAEMERLRMYRRENPPAALSRTDQTAEESG